PNESSVAPLGLSFFDWTPLRYRPLLGEFSQSMQPVVLTTRFAFVSISNALLASVAALLQLAVWPEAETAKVTTSRPLIGRRAKKPSLRPPNTRRRLSLIRSVIARPSL